jgi:hypothetical protein
VKNYIIKIIIVLIALHSSCRQSDTEVIMSKGKAYLQAVYIDNNFTEAKKLSTLQTHKVLDLAQTWQVVMSDSLKAQSKKIKISITKEPIIDSNTAIITYNLSDRPTTMELHFEKINGEWLVQDRKQNQK